MTILYIGQYSRGTTSKMRADIINEILKPKVFKVIDTNIPFYKTNRAFRTIGFRYKVGPLITNINKFILHELRFSDKTKDHTIIWVDKGVFINQNVMQKLRSVSNILVHFTPDMAFYANKSNKFIKSIHLYDYLITTKKAEIKKYLNFIKAENLLVTTQGYSKLLHKPLSKFSEKDMTVGFIGLGEPSRYDLIEKLILANIKVKVAGQGWGEFNKRYCNNPYWEYVGKGLFLDEYTSFISSASFGLGLLSKNFPEYHTTRTFEIPACGTALLTERNTEIEKFYSDEEVIYFDSHEDLIEKIKYHLRNPDKLKILTEKGLDRLTLGKYDYESILVSLLKKMKIF